MEILQVERIIHHLLYISLQRILLPHLKLKTEDNATKQQYNIYAFAKTGNVIFKDYLASLICPGLQHFLHEFYLSFPSFVCCRQSLSMIMVMKDSENFHPLRG